jgi:hypothetical protein
MSDIGTKRHIGLGLSLTAAQEQFSKAFPRHGVSGRVFCRGAEARRRQHRLDIVVPAGAASSQA